MVSPTACAAASESPIPLVKLEIPVPDIVPDIISFAILTCTVPDVGKFVADVSVKLVDAVVNVVRSNVFGLYYRHIVVGRGDDPYTWKANSWQI